ncbi:MAG: PLP-dependent aminotransferase family protein [Bacteroidota bacterium]
MKSLQQLLRLDLHSRTPIYVQLLNQLIQLIQGGKLVSGQKLPGSRTMAGILGIHRNTVTRAYEELQAQGWIEILPNQGTFVVDNLPLPTYLGWDQEETSSGGVEPIYTYYEFPHLKNPLADKEILAFDDGLPDIRLAPVAEISRAYGKSLHQLLQRKRLGYREGLGNWDLRVALAKDLRETRGMAIGPEHVLITRGTIMAMHLALASIIQPGDAFVVGKNNYQTANLVLDHLGAKLLKVSVDAQGLVTEELARICQNQPIRGLYITPHHHHPTTVCMSPERRMHLLQLAKEYNFAVLEDDYDYDFHYGNSPILPLASGDHQGRVLYVGSFTKAIAPAFRVGYLVGPETLIQKLPKIRRIWDRQGDEILEACFADLMEQGVIRRHLRKAAKTYKERRDLCAQLLHENLGEYVSFELPVGGMAIWAHFAPNINLRKTQKKALKEGLFISDGARYHPDEPQLNATRMGFASMNPSELERAVGILKRAISP